MKLADVIDKYVTLQQSLGMSFASASRILGRFSRNMGDVRIDEVTPQAVADFLQGTKPLSATWLLKHRVLSGFYRFAISRGYIGSSPLPTNLPKLTRQQTPYVYSNDELRRLIEATSILHAAHSRLQAPMYRTLLILLYGTGLRIGEALGLTLRDVGAHPHRAQNKILQDSTCADWTSTRAGIGGACHTASTAADAGS
jgi:integrase